MKNYTEQDFLDFPEKIISEVQQGEIVYLTENDEIFAKIIPAN